MKLSWKALRNPQPLEPRPDPCTRTQTNWPRWLCSEIPVDPYLVWAEVTGFWSFGSLDPKVPGDDRRRNDGALPIIVELSEDAMRLPVPDGGGAKAAGPRGSSDCPIDFALFSIQGAYIRAAEGERPAQLRQRFVTGRLAPANLDAMYLNQRYVRRFQLGLPRLPGEEARSTLGDIGPRLFDVRQTVVGLIDDGFAFAHDQFMDDNGQLRVWSLWDQDAARRPGQDGWKRVGLAESSSREIGLFGYGAELDRETMLRVIAEQTPSASPYAALGPYRAVRYLPVAPEPQTSSTNPPPNVPALTMLAATHGTSVADLAGGRVPPLAGFVARQATQGPVTSPAPTRTSTAGAWPLILVQLPTRTSLDTSGGSLAVHVLDGVRYIIDKATSIPPRRAKLPPNGSVTLDLEGTAEGPQQNDVVINISYGSSAGPHDGTSILERALQDLARNPRDKRFGFTRIVLAAGNLHRSRTHARLQLYRGAPGKSLTWQVGADNPHEAYLEIWLPDQAVGANDSPGSVLTGDDFVLRVRAPGAASDQKLCVGDALVLGADAAAAGAPDGPGKVAAMAVFARHVSQGERGTMVLLAVAPTRPRLAGTDPGKEDPRVRGPHGDWNVSVEFCPGAASTRPTERAVVHAWTERNDLVYGSPRGQQSTVTTDEPPSPPTEHSPSVREFCRYASGPLERDAPDPFRPDASFSSLAGGSGNDDPVLKSPIFGSGAVVTVGGYRASDGEMASYSSAGPARGSALDQAARPSALCPSALSPSTTASTPPPMPTPRNAPDYDAVSDISPALRGVRTAGTVVGQQARLSGTSAAAPSAVRAIAEVLFAAANFGEPNVPKPFVREVRPPGAPATLTPSKDDRDRRGRFRVKRNIPLE